MTITDFPAGWYPVDGDPNHIRYWSGSTWGGELFWDTMASAWSDVSPKNRIRLSVMSFTLGVIAIVACWVTSLTFFLPGLAAIGAIIAGSIALSKHEPAPKRAIWGIVLGSVALVLSVFLL